MYSGKGIIMTHISGEVLQLDLCPLSVHVCSVLLFCCFSSSLCVCLCLLNVCACVCVSFSTKTSTTTKTPQPWQFHPHCSISFKTVWCNVAKLKGAAPLYFAYFGSLLFFLLFISFTCKNTLTC